MDTAEQEPDFATADRVVRFLLQESEDAETGELAAVLEGWAKSLVEEYGVPSRAERWAKWANQEFTRRMNRATHDPNYFRDRDERIIDAYEGQTPDVVAMFEVVSVATVRRVRTRSGHDPSTGMARARAEGA